MAAMRLIITTVILLWSHLALSQTGPQNSSIPDCVRPCDTKAIAASNCTSEDQYCHCVRYTTILDIIVPCVQTNSTCQNGTADLLTFEELFNDVCQKFNISIPTNVTGNSTLVSTPSHSATPSSYTSQASVESAWSIEFVLSFGALVMTAICFGVFL